MFFSTLTRQKENFNDEIEVFRVETSYRLLLQKFYSKAISGEQYCQNCCKTVRYIDQNNKGKKIIRKLEESKKKKNKKKYELCW